MSTLKADKWLNTDGTENYKCRAWVNFNGTGTVAIRASGNVSSITDNGTGDYTVNFTTAMPDADYSLCGFVNSGQLNAIVDVRTFLVLSAADRDGAPTLKSTTAARVITGSTLYVPNTIDNANISLQVFR